MLNPPFHPIPLPSSVASIQSSSAVDISDICLLYKWLAPEKPDWKKYNNTVTKLMLN